MQRIYFLLNLSSGGTLVHRMYDRLRSYADSSSGAIVVDVLSREKSAEQIEKARASEIVIIGGGDGTISSIMQKLEGAPCKIGVLPLGTGNDFARELGIVKDRLPLDDPESLCRFYAQCSARLIPLWNLEYGESFIHKLSFINYVSLGFDAKVVGDFASWRSSRFGASFRGVWLNRVQYAIAGVCNLLHFLPSCTLIEDGQTRHVIKMGRGLIFANIRSIMGLGISNPVGSTFDGNVECIAVRSLFSYIPMLLHYRILFRSAPLVGSAQQWTISNLPDNVPLQVDGEPIAGIKTNQLRIKSEGTLNVLVPTFS